MLERIDKIQVYENTYENGKPNLFVIAQEFVECLPHLVKVGSTDPSYVPEGLSDPDIWGVAYDRAGVAALQPARKFYVSGQTVLYDQENRIREIEGLAPLSFDDFVAKMAS